MPDGTTTLAEARARADRNEPLPEEFYIDANARVQWKCCPICGGDCAGANPPVIYCPMKE